MKGSSKSVPPGTFSISNFQDYTQLQMKRLLDLRWSVPPYIYQKHIKQETNCKCDIMPS